MLKRCLDFWIVLRVAISLPLPPSLTPFEGGDFILEEIEACLTSNSIPSGIDDADFDPKGDILLLEKLLNNDLSSPLPLKELNFKELKIIKSSIDEPPELELKDLPFHLQYAFLEDTNKLPVIIAKNIKDEEKALLLKIFIDTQDQEKTTFTCTYMTFAYRRMPFGLCNTPGTFQRCMMDIFHDMIEETIEVFMDDFLVFGDSLSSCLSHLDKMLKRIEVDKANDVIANSLIPLLSKEPSYNQNYNDNYYPYDLPSFPCCDNCGGSHETFQCQPIAQNINFSGSDQIQNPQYPDVHLPSQEIIFSSSKDHPIFLNYNEEHSDQNKESLKNSSKEIATSNSNEEKEGPPQDSDIHQLIEECSTEVSEEQKQSMEDTMLELVKIYHQKEPLCIHDNVDDLIESALNTKLLSINSQRLEKEQQEVKNVVEQPAERGNHKPEYSPSMGYENSNTTLETESDEIIKSGVEELVPILSEKEVTLEEKRKCDVPISENSPICDDHSEIFSDSKNDDDISVYDDFEDIEYIKASLSDPEIFKDISQLQDVDLREKLLSITRLISNIESLNDNPIPDFVLNSFVSIPIFEKTDNFLLDNFSLEFKTFCDHTEETRSGNTTHADNSLPEYDSFCFEIDLDQERLINVLKSDISDDLSNDPLLEEADLFFASHNLIPPGIENVADDSEGDIRFLIELLIDDSILSHESSDSNFEDNPSIPRPPSEPPDAETDAGEEIPVVMNDKDKFDEDYCFFMFDKVFSFLFSESEDTIFDPGISA
nr:reverse transcriptase domain-containing protein [Tanacetum cinerariifolium]